MQRFNDTWWETDPISNWNDAVDHMAGTAALLAAEHGTGNSLIAYTDDSKNRGSVNLETFVQRCYPSQVLDVIEAHYAQLLPEQGQAQFENEVNRVLREERVPWRMTTGEACKIDSQFLDVELVEQTEAMLSARGFAGALDELREARADLTANETRESIAKSHSAMESAMKTILGVSTGSASELLRQLNENGFFDDLPEEHRASFREQVLMSLPTLGNRLGRHGQGPDVVEVPRHYAELTLFLAAAFIRVLVERRDAILAEQVVVEPAVVEQLEPEPEFVSADDDIPF